MITCSAYHLSVSIVALLSNEDKKSSPKDMGERLPICGGVFREASAAWSTQGATPLRSIEIQ